MEGPIEQISTSNPGVMANPMAMVDQTAPSVAVATATAVAVVPMHAVETTMQVQVPAGVTAGQMMAVNTPTGQMQIAVPAGVAPGQMIQVNVPAPTVAVGAATATAMPVTTEEKERLARVERFRIAENDGDDGDDVVEASITQEKLRAKFEELDANGNSTLEGEEVRKLVAWAYSISHEGRLSADKQEAVADKILSNLDADGDGKLTFDEARGALRKYLVEEAEYE